MLSCKRLVRISRKESITNETVPRRVLTGLTIKANWQIKLFGHVMRTGELEDLETYGFME